MASKTSINSSASTNYAQQSSQANSNKSLFSITPIPMNHENLNNGAKKDISMYEEVDEKISEKSSENSIKDIDEKTTVSNVKVINPAIYSAKKPSIKKHQAAKNIFDLTITNDEDENEINLDKDYDPFNFKNDYSLKAAITSPKKKHIIIKR